MTDVESPEPTYSVRFKPPGLDPEERVGTVFEMHYDPELDHTMYCIEDDEDGTRYQLGESAILAPEETAL